MLQGEEILSDYQFGERTIHHLFCSRCGVKPFGRGFLEELGGTFYAVNIACLDGLSDAEFAALPVTVEGDADYASRSLLL